MNKLLTICLLGLAGLGLQTAHAHGQAQARHGGALAQAHDLEFELVARDGGATIYVRDHGKPIAPTGMSGKLTVLKGSDKTDHPLTAETDRLLAPGAKLPGGSKAVAVLATADKKVITVRFTIK